ncbi:hypothetical protein [Algoriphagus namhaensis]
MQIPCTSYRVMKSVAPAELGSIDSPSPDSSMERVVKNVLLSSFKTKNFKHLYFPQRYAEKDADEAWCVMLGARCLMLGAGCPVLDDRCRMTGAGCLVPGCCTNNNPVGMEH